MNKHSQPAPLPKQIGMDQLGYFVGMLEHNLDPRWQERFWQRIRENCPDLMKAIDAKFLDSFGDITFTRALVSPAFDPALVFADEESQL